MKLQIISSEKKMAKGLKELVKQLEGKTMMLSKARSFARAEYTKINKGYELEIKYAFQNKLTDIIVKKTLKETLEKLDPKVKIKYLK